MAKADLRQRFNWGYHDGAAAQRRRMSYHHIDRNPDIPYTAGWRAGWIAAKNNENTDDSENAWREYKKLKANPAPREPGVMRFRELRDGDVFDFAAEKFGTWSDAAGGYLRWQGARGPWIKTGNRSYTHKETGAEHRVGSINAKVIRSNPTEMRRSHWEAMNRRKSPPALRRSRREAAERKSRAPWSIVAEMKAGEPGTEYGIDAVTPVAWIVSRRTIRRREYGYGLPVELTNSPAFAQWMGGAKSKRVIESLARMRATFRQMLPLRKNPAPRRLDAAPEVQQAAKLHEDFTGRRPTKMRRARVPSHRAALDIGPVLALAYRTTRDGKRENYLHEFRRGARPTLAASNDGRSLYLLGGAYRFTERGIVDE